MGVHAKVQGLGTGGKSSHKGGRVLELQAKICTRVQGPKNGGENPQGGQYDNLGYELLLQFGICPVFTRMQVGVRTKVLSLHESPKARTRRELKILKMGGY